MTDIRELKKKWRRDPAFVMEYQALESEFDLVSALIEARSEAGLTQEEIARQMKTSQTAIARMESGRQLPSMKTLQKFAEATKTRLKISFEPKKHA